ncbi:MAG: 3-demethylubiquinone-9 3-methyltransferase [Labilithrix sp.]|nr:3-demethylubiquinone-9 3-methyltransferase [Labilithrix sp.]
MQKITTFLTYDSQAAEAADHYLSVFEQGKVLSTMPGPGGTVSGVTFELFGQTFFALNAGPSFTFSSGISLFVSCETQEEIDRYWGRLLAGGGKELRCGWITDTFGVSWQIVPARLAQLLGAPERDKAGRAMQAMMTMKKLDIGELERAFEGR